MGIDDLFQDLLELLLAYMEINLQKQLVSFCFPVHKAQVLGNDLIKQQTSQCRVDHALLLGAILHSLLHTHLDPGVQCDISILIGQDRFIDALKDHALAFGSRPLLGQIIDPEYHILRRNRHRTAVGRL